MSELPSRGFLRRALPRIVVSLLLAGGFVWLLSQGGLPLIPPRESLARVPGSTYAASVVLLLAAIFARTYRWNYLVHPIAPRVPPLRVMGISLVGFGAVFLLPLRSGEVVRPYLLARDGEVTFMQAAGTVGAERVIDGLVLTLFTFVALSLATPISPLPSRLGDLPLPVAGVPAAVYGALLMFSSAFAVMIAFYAARDHARRLTERVVGLVSKRLARWMANTLARVADGLSFLPSRSHFLAFMAWTLGYWGLSIASQWVLLRGLLADATFAQATTTVGVQGLGSLAPAGPGMFGAYQIAGFSALAMFFPMTQVKAEGALFLFLTYTTQLVLNVLQLAGGLLLMSSGRPKR